MKNNNNFFLISACIVMILVCAVIVAGCTSNVTPTKSDSPLASSIAIPSTTYQAPVLTPAITTVTSTHVPMNVLSLSNGIFTITYPSNWEKEELSETSLREYGRVTTNIVNFFSPSYGNKDAYTTFSIDVDPQPVSDNDRYFNLATVAIQKEYGNIDITHHTQQYKTGYAECTVCKGYNLEFETKTLNRWYHFIDVDGTFYIITINNPHNEASEMLRSIKIIPPSTQKHR